MRVVARVRALLPTDWFGRAGARFREGTSAVSSFAEEHGLTPGNVIEEGIELGRKKIEGLAHKEYAAAVKDYAEAEQKKIDIELQRRSLESKVRREEAEARIAELKALDAEIELYKKLTELSVAVYRDAKGNLTVLSARTGTGLGVTQELTPAEDQRRLTDR